MHPAALTLLLILTFALQGVVMPRLEWGGGRPDAALALTLFLAFHARRPASWWGGVLVGAVCALGSSERPGVFVLTYGALGLLVATVREYLFIYNLLVQALAVFACALATHAAWWIYRRWTCPQGMGFFADESAAMLRSALLTSLLALVMHRLLLAASKWLGVPEPKYRAARWM